jgi:hypothetical protein
MRIRRQRPLIGSFTRMHGRYFYLSQPRSYSFVSLSEAKNLGSLFGLNWPPGMENRSDMFRFAQRDLAICDTKVEFSRLSSKAILPREALAFRLHLNIRGASLSDIYLNFLCICVL